MNEIFVGLIALAGVFVGGFLNFIFNRLSSKSDFDRNTELKAYLTYLNAVSGVTISLRDGKDENEYRDYLINLTKAKTEISLVGSNETINCLVEFEKNEPVIKDKKSEDLFIKIVVAMRKSLRKKEIVELNHIAILLFGHNIK